VGGSGTEQMMEAAERTEASREGAKVQEECMHESKDSNHVVCFAALCLGVIYRSLCGLRVSRGSLIYWRVTIVDSPIRMGHR
jgi:hypothetical protein